MKNWLLPVAVLVVAVAALSCDQPPVIERVVLSRTPVPPSDTVTVTAIARSPMGDALTYRWTVVRGTTIDPVGNPVVFKTSKVSGYDTVALLVLDSHAREATDTVAIEVRSP